MCGIAGIVIRDPRVTVDESRLRRMRDALRHRGPDDAGSWSEGPVALGHRRLSIVDVAGGHQPMANEDESAWIVYNGEIYNHASLRPGLEERGHRYRSRSDTETILHLFEEEGERCVEQLQGMFAFAIWDRRDKSLLLARDRLGIKPLYYAANDRELLFGSEIKAILAAATDRPTFNRDVIGEFLATRFVSGEETFFRGIYKVPPGCTMRWTGTDRPRTRRYWRLPLDEDHSPAGLRERAIDLRSRLEATVSSHLMSDVPLGVFLSGGIDSSGLAALMAPLLGQPLRTFSVGFAEREANELEYARLAAQAVRAQHREVVVSAAEFFDALPRLVWHEDEPIAFPSSVPLYFVSRLASEHVKVVLTGEGADELFLGYNRYRVTAWNARLHSVYTRTVPDGIRALILRAIRASPRNLRRYGERSFLALESGPRGLFYENFAVFRERARNDLIADPNLLRRDPYAVSLRHYGEGSGGALARMGRADLQTYLVELLMKQDQMSMAASVESRVPFLDHELVEHVVATPARFKVRGWQTKAMLRAALRDVVPAEILRRPKMGFPVPLASWFRGRARPLIDDLVLGPRATERRLFRTDFLRMLVEEHQRGIADHADRLWLLANLEIWQRIFLDGDETASLPRVVCEFSG